MVPFLRRNERVQIDSTRVTTLFNRLGEGAAEDAVCRAMEELAVRLATTQTVREMGDMARVAKVARGMIGIAEEVGLVSLARVASDVALCATAGDETAMGATLARLVRVGDKSMTEIWDLRDLSI